MLPHKRGGTLRFGISRGHLDRLIGYANLAQSRMLNLGEHIAYTADMLILDNLVNGKNRRSGKPLGQHLLQQLVGSLGDGIFFNNAVNQGPVLYPHLIVDKLGALNQIRTVDTLAQQLPVLFTICREDNKTVP